MVSVYFKSLLLIVSLGKTAILLSDASYKNTSARVVSSWQAICLTGKRISGEGNNRTCCYHCLKLRMISAFKVVSSRPCWKLSHFKDRCPAKMLIDWLSLDNVLLINRNKLKSQIQEKFSQSIKDMKEKDFRAVSKIQQCLNLWTLSVWWEQPKTKLVSHNALYSISHFSRMMNILKMKQWLRIKY